MVRMVYRVQIISTLTKKMTTDYSVAIFIFYFVFYRYQV